jgi:hypothetical protein
MFVVNIYSNVSEEYTTSIFRVTDSESGGLWSNREGGICQRSIGRLKNQKNFHPSLLTTGQNVFKPFGITDTFLSPECFNIHLKYIQALWRLVQYVPPSLSTPPPQKKNRGTALLHGMKNKKKKNHHLESVLLVTAVSIVYLDMFLSLLFAGQNVYVWLPWLRFPRAFSSVVMQMPG